MTKITHERLRELQADVLHDAKMFGPHSRAAEMVAVYDLALRALEPQQEEAVAWQRRIKYPSIPGEVPQWEQCSWREATGHFERSALHEYRPLYAHPTPVQKVQESQTVSEEWIRDTAMNVMLATEVDEAIRILTAALEPSHVR